MTQSPERPSAEALAKVLEQQRAYEERKSSRFGRGAEDWTAPLGSVIGKLVPPGLVRQGLDAADRLAGMTLPGDVTGHDLHDVEACNAAALRVQAWAASANAATGGAAGWFGGAAVAMDIPATISLAARNVRATGAAYGFDDNSDDERAFRLMVMQVATTSAGQGRRETLASLNDLAAWLQTPEGRVVLEKGGEWLTDKVVERIARQLGLSLASRKAGQVVPIVGGAVGAVVNASFQTDISRAARYAYRQRWLMARRLLPAPEMPA